MPRRPRKESALGIYHVVIKGADRQLLFEESKDYLKYLDILAVYMEECHFKLFAYCLMSNHVHLLIQTTDIPLASIFRRLNTTYAGWFNAKYQRTGFLQDGRYFSEPVDSTEYLLNVLRYIHFNPTKAGLESFPGEKYRWNSFLEYKNSAETLISTEFILNHFQNYNEFLLYHKNSTETCLDIDHIRKRLPDDVAKDIIQEFCHCSTTTDFQNLSQRERNKYIKLLHEKGLSIRQINRLTGTPRGVIERKIH